MKVGNDSPKFSESDLSLNCKFYINIPPKGTRGGGNLYYKGLYRCAAGMGYTFQVSKYMNGYHFHLKNISMGYLFHSKSI